MWRGRREEGGGRREEGGGRREEGGGRREEGGGRRDERVRLVHTCVSYVYQPNKPRGELL